MAKIHSSIIELVGNTPLVELTNYQKKHGLGARIIGKLEYLNPTGSSKDRLAVALIEDARAKGAIEEGSTLIDVTSGNTGISLVGIGHAEGLKFIPYLEPGTSEERVKIFEGYGLDTRSFTDVEEIANFEQEGLNLDDLIAGMERIAEEQSYYYAGQTVNEANQEYHYKTTGPEIWEDTDGQVDYIVATAGTAGTLVGTGRYLREKNPEITVVGVQGAETSRPENENFTGNIIDGTLPVGNLPEEFVPTLIRSNRENGFIMDEIIDVAAEDAYKTAQETAETDGLFLGTSAAAALNAAIQIAARPEAVGKNIVVIYPDNGYKYLSTDLYKRS
ncbi:PLP-dependent cysteine synthase family protein [Corynebacterium lubricantis]|uniref:PLP-dependent cysteine synthase family protein n=1 Tax=Corynebacterium lubricantis TaxID=541095 RepID=UPI00035F555C|nr:PLP-dependent cysteine synthase family protein [Corynebacterium lubricantis]